MLSFLNPPIKWAQRSSLVFLTIDLQDCTDTQISLKDNIFYFFGISDQKSYKCQFPFYAPVVPEESSHIVRPRHIEVKVVKEEEKFWPSLVSDYCRRSFIQVDWNNWKEEDQLDDPDGDDSFSQFGLADEFKKTAEMEAMLRQFNAAEFVKENQQQSFSDVKGAADFGNYLNTNNLSQDSDKLHSNILNSKEFDGLEIPQFGSAKNQNNEINHQLQQGSTDDDDDMPPLESN